MAETLNLGEYPKRHIDYLVEELGLIETPEMVVLRQLATEAMAAGGEHARELSIEYLHLGEQLVEGQEYENKNQARVGLNIARALMYREAGRIDDYYEYTLDILDDLYNLVVAGFEEFARIIDVLESEMHVR